MLENLTYLETEMMYLYAQGQTYSGTVELLEVDSIQYNRIKRSMLRKLKIKRITEILPFLLKNEIALR